MPTSPWLRRTPGAPATPASVTVTLKVLRSSTRSPATLRRPGQGASPADCRKVGT